MVQFRISRNFIRHFYSAYKMPVQNYDCFLILDFEATCEELKRISKPEIIEFPVLKVDGNTFDVTEKFHSYVKPVLNPQLSDFCTKLTGITQSMVDTSEVFPTVFGNFLTWLMEKVGPKERFLFVTCGDWDLKSMLPEQCTREDVVLPSYFNTWMNIKKAYSHQTGIFTKGMMPMLKDLNIKHVGRHHSGIDDCRNIVNILTALHTKGCVFRPTAGEKRHGPPPQPQLAAACATKGAYSNSASGNASRQYSTSGKQSRFYSKSDQTDKSSLYPSLSGYETVEKGGAYTSSLYEPDDHTEGDRNVSVKYDGASGASKGALKVSVNLKKPSKDPDRDVPECPDFDTIVRELTENLLSKQFKSRDQEELQALCASGKYLHAMDKEDRHHVENRLRFFYVTLVHGHRVAKKDAKTLSTEAVGIRVDPELVSSKRRHDKGSRKHKHEHSGHD